MLNATEMYLRVDSLQPAFFRHVDFEHDIEVASMIGRFVLRHTLSSEDDAIARLDDLALGACYVNTAAIQMREEDPRESKQSFG